MAKIRFGLIGFGRIAPKHVEALRQLGDQAELVAICDSNPAKQAKIQETGARYYADYREMLENEQLDAVSILTWSGNHAEIALGCAGKVKNLIVEKPMALRLEDADTMIEACERGGTRLFVVKQNRYNPPVQALRKALDEGRVGRLITGMVRVRWSRDQKYYDQDKWRGTWEWDGGVFANQAIHFVDLLTLVFGEVESVFAKTGTYLSKIEAEDTGAAILKFKNGALGLIEATTCVRPKDLEGSLSVLGEKASIEIAGFACNQVRTWNFSEPRPEDAAMQALATDPPNVYGFGHLDFMSEAVRAIRENRPSAIDGQEGRRSLELVTAIYESAETGREIVISGFRPSKARLGRKIQTPGEMA